MAEGISLDQFMTLPAKTAPAKGISVDDFMKLPAAQPKRQAEGSFPAELGKGIVGGAISSAGTALKGQAAADQVARADRREYWLAADRYFARIDAGKEPGKILDPDLPGLIELYQGSTPEQRAQLREAAQAAAKIHPVEDVTQTPLFKAGEATQKFAAENFAAAKNYEGSITRQFGEALGSMATMVGAGIVNRGAGVLSGVQMSVGEQVDMALRKGASKEDVLTAANLAFFPGATEYAPIDTFFSKIPVGKWGKFADALVKLGKGFVVEGGQEGLQQFMQNKIAQFTYNPKQDPYENVAEGVLIGGAVGTTVAAAALPFTLGGEQQAAPRPEGEPRPRYEPPADTATQPTAPPPGGPPAGVPEGAAPADTILPPEEPDAEAVVPFTLVPEDQAPPAPILQPTMVVNDPAFTANDGTEVPAGELHGQTVKVLQRGESMSVVETEDGRQTRIGNPMLVEPPAAEPAAPAEPAPVATTPKADRLTPDDRASPISDDIIDAGKALVEDATGKPSTVTTTEVVDGQRRVVDTPVATIVAKDRAETAALVEQVTAGVGQPEITELGQQGEPPASAAEVAATPTPETAAAPVRPPVAPPAAAETSDTASDVAAPPVAPSPTREDVDNRIAALSQEAAAIQQKPEAPTPIDTAIVTAAGKAGPTEGWGRHVKAALVADRPDVAQLLVDRAKLAVTAVAGSDTTVATKLREKRTVVADNLQAMVEGREAPTPAPKPVGAEGKYADGTEWKASYAPVQRTDGTYVLTRTMTDEDGTRVHHLTEDGMWAKGEPSSTVVQLGQGIKQIGARVEAFDTADRAMQSAKDDAVDLKENMAPAPRAAPPASAKPVAGTPEPNKATAPVRASEATGKAYPIAPRDEWYGEGNYEQAGGRMTSMTPDEFLGQARPLDIDEASRENIDILKEHIQSGKTLDPLNFSAKGKEDGRHRAIAAKELGIDRVPVIDYRPADTAPRTSGETDKVFAKRVVDKRPAPETLPEKHGDYFVMDKATVIPLNRLISTKTEEENKQGGDNGAKRMAAAAKGELNKREPITVELAGDGKYRITDGNGTFTTVQKYGWKGIPVIVKGEPAAQTALREKVTAKREEEAAATAPRAADETDKQFAKRVVDKRPAPKTLPEKYGDYFLMDKPTVAVVPIGDLVSTKTDEENAQGGGNAAKRMAAAAKGELEKRDPITVERRPDGKYLILDGNGTYTSVKALGWKNMPVIVAAPEARFAAKREEAAPAATAHLTSFTGEAVTPEQEHRFKNSPYTTIDALYEDAQARQDEMAAVGEEIASRMDGVELANPGLKAKKKSAEKVEIKGYKSAGQITDAIRMGFMIDQPGKASQIIRELAHHFELIDEQWAVTSAGYFDRKVIIKFADGRLAEVQFWEPHLFQAKEFGLPGIVGGEKGHDLYDEWNALRKNNPTDPKLDKLSQQMNELYAHALSLASDRAWAIVLSEGRLSKPEPKYLNLSRQASSDISRQEMYTSPKSASTHSVSPGSSNALASKSVSTTGRMSQLQNLTAISETPPSTGNVLRKPPEVKPEPEAQRELKEKIEAKRKAAEPEAKFAARLVGQGPVAATPTGGKKGDRLTVKDIAQGFHDEHMATEGRQLFPEKDTADYDHVVKDMAEPELQSQMDQRRSGVGWYQEDTADAIDITSQLFPTLATNPEHRDLFLIYAGIFGNGPDPVTAWLAAGEAFDLFQRTGEIPVSRPEATTKAGLPVKMSTFRDKNTKEMKSQPTGWTQRNAANEQQIGMFKRLVEKKGSITAAMHWLTHPQPRSEINQAMKDAGYASLRYPTVEDLKGPDEYGALIFGPKLGRYVLGLNGIELTSGDATVDKWFVRTYRRWTGRLFEGPIDESGIAGQPNPKEKDLERRTIFRMVGDLAKRFGLKPGDVQAVLWFHEQRLYDASGVPTEAGTNTDGAIKLLEQRGVQPVRKDVDARSDAAGDRTGRKNEPPAGTQEVGYAFVSPNVAEGGDITEAVRGIASVRQRALLSASKAIDAALGIVGFRRDAVGAWSDGAENTTVVAVTSDTDWETLKVAAAMKGHLADQKAVLIFKQDDAGTSVLYRMRVPETNVRKLRDNLVADGVAFHTLVLHKDGTDVIVADLDGSALDAMEKAAERYDVEFTSKVGQADFIGTESRDNDPRSDREQRDDARRAYEEVIRQSPVQGAREHWKRVHDHWGETLSQRPDTGRQKVSRDQSGVTRETLRGGHVEYTLRPEFKAKAAAILKDLQPLLDKLAPGTPLRIFESIRALVNGVNLSVDAQYLRGVVDLAMNADGDLASLLHHEAVHALWDSFTKIEKAILERRSKKEWITDEIKATYPEERWVEEGIAHAIARWHAGTRMDGVVAKAFKRFMAIVRAIGSAFTANGIRTAEDVFADVASGRIGQRLAQARTFRKPETQQRDGSGRFVESLFQAAWHGTPHLVDRFSTAFMGTGEGAQAFGWGLYFAGKKEVGEYYRKALTLKSSPFNDVITYWVDHAKGDWKRAAEAYEEEMDRITPRYDPAADETLKALKAGPPGNLYKVNIPDDDKLMAWDKPLSQQAGLLDKVLAKLGFTESAAIARAEAFEEQSQRVLDNPSSQQEQAKWDAMQREPRVVFGELLRDMRKPKGTFGYDAASKVTGERLYRALSRSLGSDKAASELLRDVGIPGHRFLDQLSRTTGTGTHNYVIYDDAAIDIEARFALTAAPHTPQQVQQTMQGFISRGQPIDRAIRLPLQLFGGIDEQGRWRPGKRLSDKIGPQRREGGAIGAITGSLVGGIIAGPLGAGIGASVGLTVGGYVLGSPPAPANGRFPWLSGIAENAKRGLISDYGLDPEYIEAYRKSDLGKTQILRKAAGIMKVLHNAGVSSVEAKVLQSILSGTPVNDAEMTRLAEPIRKAIDDLGAEAVSLGLISAESFERNRGAYLHRVYQKHEAIDDGSLAGWVSKAMAKRRKRIIGDSLKGRGMFWEVPVERLLKDAPNRGVPGKGDKWRVLDRTSADGKVSRRVYVPADKPTPVEFTFPGWVDRGEWEVRQVQGVTPAGSAKKMGPQEATGVTLWRDYTEAERSQMGEIVDARYTIAKTFMLMANDLSTGRFYREISQKAEWTSDTEPASPWKEGGEYNARNGRFWTDPEIQWVKVPDTAIAKTGGKKKWGALAGKWVRAEIWRDLNEIDVANTPGTWRKLYAQWKKNKTARNPVVHMNNIMSNVMFMDMADIRAQDLVSGINAYARSTKDFQEALDNGAFGSDIVAQELRDNVLKPILDEIAKQSTGTTLIPFLAKAGVVGAVAEGVWTWAKKIDNGMLRAYQMEDEIFRMAAYMRRRSQGATPAEAGREARDQFLNYDIRAPWVLAMRNTVLPFISYTYRAVPKLAENIMHRPWKIAKYATIAYAINALSYMLDEGDDDEDKEKGRLLNREQTERAGLRDEEQGHTWLRSPRMIRMPWRDANGMPVFLDVRRWIPAGDVFDSAPGSTALPIPAPLQFGGPLQLAFEFNLNKSAFTGEQITNELTDTPFEKASDIADWAWKSWAPASFWTPRSWYWTKIANALYGAKDQSGNVYSVTQAVLSSFGIKVKPLDVENGVMWHYKDFKQVQIALKSQLRAAARQLDRGMISQSTFDKEAASVYRKFENLGVKIDELSENTRPKREPVQ